MAESVSPSTQARDPARWQHVLAFLAFTVLAADAGVFLLSMAESGRSARALEQLDRVDAAADGVLTDTVQCAAARRDPGAVSGSAEMGQEDVPASCRNALAALKLIEDFLGAGHPSVASMRAGLESLSPQSAGSDNTGAALSSVLALAPLSRTLHRDVSTLVKARTSENLSRAARQRNFLGLTAIALAFAAFALYRREIVRARLLKAAEERYRQFASLFADIMWEFDPEGAIVFAQGEVLKPARSTGEPNSDQSNSDQIAGRLGLTGFNADAVALSLRDRRSFDGIERRLRIDGIDHIYEMSGRPIYGHDGAYRGFRIIARDISARRIDNLEQVLNLLGRAICIGDRRSLTVEYGNEVYWDLFGRPRGGAKPVLFESQHALDHLPQGLMAEIARGIETERGWTGEFDTIGQDGRPRHFYATARALTEGRFAMVMSDLTERELRTRDELQRQRQHSDTERLGAISSLAGGIAHDFNNIIGAIRGFAGLLVSDLDKASAQHRYADRIVSSCRRAEALVKEIMAYSQIYNIKHARLFADEATAGIADILLSRSEKGVVFKLNRRAPRCMIEGSSSQLLQVLSNLVLNAVDASSPDSLVTLDVTRVEPNDHLLKQFHSPERVAKAPDGSLLVWQGGLAPGRPYVVFTVADRGAGMTLQVLERMFEPFFSTKGAGRGSGLGLAIVAAIVAAHCGAIRVRSKLEAGTTFEIYVPVVEERDRTDCIALPLIANADAIRGRERILIVDDETDIAEALAVALQRLGYEAVHVDDPAEALKIFTEDPRVWDVVVSDYAMPGMGGLLLLRKMRALNPDLRTMICTGYSDILQEDNAARFGLDAFFRKPTTAEAIAKAIRGFFSAA